jgi:alanine racemase
MDAPLRAEAYVDLAAIRHNVAALCRYARNAGVMVVVKADGYGHGIAAAARAAVAGGATWIGTAVLEEALAVRAAGITTPILSWLATPGEPYEDALAASIDVAAYAPWQLAGIASAAAARGTTARVHLKVDTGLGRGGAQPHDWAELVDAAAAAQADGTIDVVGIWSHLACADEPGHPSVERQRKAFEEAFQIAERKGIRAELKHLANSAATVSAPDTHYDLVRAGIASYGLSPIPDHKTSDELGLVPAMTLRARLALVKRAPKGHGVSYGHRYVTPDDTTLGLVPLGYGDGVPRAASNVGPVWAAGEVRQIAGTVCMDQFVLDLGDASAKEGDDVVLFGPGAHGEPTAQDWAEATGTISYEIVTRLGTRVPRTYGGLEESS